MGSIAASIYSFSGLLTFLLYLIAIPVILFWQSLTQKIILSFIGIQRNKKSFLRVNAYLFPLISVIGYLALPFQIIAFSKFAGINKKTASLLGVIEFIYIFAVQVSIIIILYVFDISGIRTIVKDLQFSPTQMIWYSLILFSISVFMAFFRNKLSLSRKFQEDPTVERHESATTVGRNDTKIFKAFSCVPYAALPIFVDALGLLILSTQPIKISSLLFIFICLTCGYIAAVISQIPGGIGVREITSALLLSNYLDISVMNISLLLGGIRLLKVLSGCLTGLIIYLRLGFAHVQD
jgi:uncharacterized membrane protein YbhN (UPF0104 family)